MFYAICILVISIRFNKSQFIFESDVYDPELQPFCVHNALFKMFVLSFVSCCLPDKNVHTGVMKGVVKW